MKFEKKLFEGVLLQRYKRFFADVEYKGEKLTIHVPNTGSMRGVIDKNLKQKCWFSLHGDKSKKLKGTLEALQSEEGTWVGVNTANPNRIVKEAIEESFANNKPHFKHWSKYKFYKPECKISKETRLDGVFCIEAADLDDNKIKKHFIEIKNTTMMNIVNKKNAAMFPDSVTERGQKHLREMMKLIKLGHTAEVIFTVQRSDAAVFRAASEIDPKYAELLIEAEALGLIISPVVVDINQTEVKLTKHILKYCL